MGTNVKRTVRASIGFACLAALGSVSATGREARIPAAGNVPPAPTSRTIGLAITDLRWAMYETADHKEECPAGLQVGTIEMFKSMPNPKERIERYGLGFALLGPNGENSETDPMAVPDIVPWKDVGTKKGYGFNLDGTTDGHPTAKTCKHEKFTSPEGEQIDNQIARSAGCAKGFRTNGFSTEFYSTEVQTSPVNRHLIEISDVDSEVNDPEVLVTIYKGRDGVVPRSDRAAFVPYMTHRIDTLFPEYILKTRGKIVDGTLITDPIALARMPILFVQTAGETRLRDMRLRLKLTPDGATGYLGGYEDIERLWHYVSKAPAAGSGEFNAASFYRSMLRNADGDPDPATGQCKAISVAYKTTAVRAIIVHPKGTAAQRIASAGRGDRGTRVARAQD